jgi:WD40-like Beta Propeller Repeat
MLRRVTMVLLTGFLQACMASSLVLHVQPDGSGQAEIKARVFESGMRAFDSLFPGTPTPPAKLEELLPPPQPGQLEREFGTRVRLVSSDLKKDPDGGTRTTLVAFDDVTALRLMFPPVTAMPAGSHFSLIGVPDTPVITFAVKAHENGDRLLLVNMPDQRVNQDPNAPITTFETNSAEEQTLKRAIKNMSLGFFVELERPLLRTNAPAQDGNRATILHLDLERMINAMDERTVRRMMTPGSLQEMLWQAGDLPGATVPVDREIFLEYEPAPATQAGPPAAAQAPPDTEIYLASLTRHDGTLEVGPAENITNNPGYDNQPFFTPDSRGILFTSVRGSSPGVREPAPAQTDIYRYDLASRAIARVTQTAESEYSPTVMPDGTRISVVRVEADGAQRLWSIAPSGPKIQLDLLLPGVKPVGYHAWADDHTVALFVLGQPATLQLADTRTGTAHIVASDIGRSIQAMPGNGGSRHISFVQRERSGGAPRLLIMELDPSTGNISPLTSAVDGSTEADTAWTPDGTLLMVKGTTLYGWRRGDAGWKEVTSLERLSLSGVSRLAVSPDGAHLALVGAPRQSR